MTYKVKFAWKTDLTSTDLTSYISYANYALGINVSTGWSQKNTFSAFSDIRITYIINQSNMRL